VTLYGEELTKRETVMLVVAVVVLLVVGRTSRK